MERFRDPLASEQNTGKFNNTSTALGTCEYDSYKLIHNYTLHAILLTQIVLETLNDLTVPPAPQGPNFTYRMNAKEVMMRDLNSKNAKQIAQLEEQTGVDLEHYHKLKIENKWT